MRLLRMEEGFTLVELMVVVLIIGILVAIAVPVFNTAKASAQKRSCQSQMRSYEGAYQTYYADLGTSTTFAGITALGDLAPEYVKAVKPCPTKQEPYRFSYDYVPSLSGITVDCDDPDIAPAHNAR